MVAAVNVEEEVKNLVVDFVVIFIHPDLSFLPQLLEEVLVVNDVWNFFFTYRSLHEVEPLYEEVFRYQVLVNDGGVFLGNLGVLSEFFCLSVGAI